MLWRMYVNNRDGAAIELEDGSLFPIQVGRVHFIPAGVRFHCHNSTNVSHLYVHFDLLGPPSLLIRQAVDRPVRLPPEPDLDARAATLAQAIAVKPGFGLEDVFSLKALVHDAFARLLRSLPPGQADRFQQLATGQEAVLPAMLYVDDHLAEPLTNTDLASLCHLSEDHFIRRFRDAIGQTPAQYVTQRRIAAAAQRLVFTRDSIDQIAEATGFGNRFYFSRVFDRHMGTPPAAYRKTVRI